MKARPIFLFAILLGIAGSARALPLFHVDIGCGMGTIHCPAPAIRNVDSLATVAVSASETSANPPVLPSDYALLTARESAAASQQWTLGVLSEASVTFAKAYANAEIVGSAATAAFYEDNFVLSGPPGTSAIFSLNVAGQGTFALGASGASFQSEASASAFAMQGPTPGSTLPEGFLQNAASFSDNLGDFYQDLVSPVATTVRSGIFSGLPTSSSPIRDPHTGAGTFGGGGSGVATTPEIFDVRSGDAFSVILGITTSVLAQHLVSFPGVAGSATASLDFSHTLGFPADGPVFNLPDGYTVNSADGLIVNNRFVPGAVTTVPEPGTLALLSIGLTSLGFCRLKRRT